MESLVAVILFFVAIALSVSAFLVISNRRQAKPYPIASEVQVPPEVREAVRRKADAEAMRPQPQKRGLLRQPSFDDNTPFQPVDPVVFPDPIETVGGAAAAAAAPAAEDAPAEVAASPGAGPAGMGPRAHRPLSPGSHVPLVDALVGMHLPCELLFLSNVQAEPGIREVMAFVTTGHEPAAVAGAFADELERLEYELTPGQSERELLASRADVSFKVAVHDRADSVVRAGARAFPTAPAAGVVVEISS